MALLFEPLQSKRHERLGFACGQESLDRYLRERASQDQKRNVASAFVLVDPPSPQVVAYYTLSAYVVELGELDAKTAKRLPRYPHLPATLLGRLAVSRDRQGEGLGELVLMDALHRALLATAQVASMAVVAEALDEAAGAFYRRYGFQQFQGHPLKLYLPMQTIRQLF